MIDFIEMLYYRIFVRGHCALFGCKESSGVGWNMPEDCVEWHCPRCGAEGVNAQVWTREIFYNDDRIQNFIEALKGN